MYVCASICLSVCVCVSNHRRTQNLNQLTDLVQIRYLESTWKYPGPFIFNFPPCLKLTIVHIRKGKEKNSDFLQNDINNFDEILQVYSTFNTQHYGTTGFSEKSIKLENYFLIYCPSSKHWPISFKFNISCKYLQPVFPFLTHL